MTSTVPAGHCIASMPPRWTSFAAASSRSTGEIEHRLAVIVLLVFAAEAPTPDAEGVVARRCVDRLMARCAMA